MTTDQNSEFLPEGVLSAMSLQTDAICKEVLSQVRKLESKDLSLAVCDLMTHIACNLQAISILYRDKRMEEYEPCVGNPTTVLLRCIYDAQIQLMYILESSEMSEKRAVQYLKYGAIENYKFLELIEESECALAKRISSIPKRDETKQLMVSQYNQCKNSEFWNKWGRDRWYKGTLFDLARIVGREEEYTWYVRFSSGAVHASPFATSQGALMPNGADLFLASTSVVYQCVIVVLDSLNLCVCDKLRRWMDTFAEDYCNARLV